MIRRPSIARYPAALAVFAWPAADLLACTACFGQSDSPMAKGMNMGIFTLLLVITSVLFGIAGFFVYLVRRGTQLTDGQPLDHQLSEHRTNA